MGDINRREMRARRFCVCVWERWVCVCVCVCECVCGRWVCVCVCVGEVGV